MIATLAPSLTNSRDVASPIPLSPPVIKATLSASRPIDASSATLVDADVLGSEQVPIVWIRILGHWRPPYRDRRAGAYRSGLTR